MVTIEVQGMSCGRCASVITDAIKRADPAAEVQVDLPARRVRVDGAAGAEALRQAIRDAGYQPVA